MKSFLRTVLISAVTGCFVFYILYDTIVEKLDQKYDMSSILSLSTPADVRVVADKKTPDLAYATKNGSTGNRSYNDVNVSFINAAEATVNSVVHVKSSSVPVQNYSGSGKPLWDFFWGNRGNHRYRRQPVEGFGSGVIITKDGFIVTNNHVVESATKVEVTLNNKKTYEAKVIGRDPSTDIALLKIEATGLPAIVFGDSENLKVGEWVLAVGNPFNLRSTVTSGIISAKSRDVNLLGNQGLEAFIQTDAAVNPGNSGGALVNLSGELVGICTAISTKTGSFSGYSFAVPSNIAKKVVEDLLEYGRLQRAYLGVQVIDLDAKTVEQYKLSVDEFEGVYVHQLMEDYGAVTAGIEAGDVITQIDDVRIRKRSDLIGYLGTKRPGDKVKVKVLRVGEAIDLVVELRNDRGTTRKISRKKNEQEVSVGDFGADLEPISNREKDRYGITYGLKVKITKRGKFFEWGVPQGAVILKIGDRKIYKVSDVYAGLRKGGQTYMKLFLPDRGTIVYIGVNS